MNNGYFYFPMPVNEPVLSYAPGSMERKILKDTLARLKSEVADIPMYIGGKEIRTGVLEAPSAS
jgi:1-pyrroline-5-carboxylate dehydrogenase